MITIVKEMKFEAAHKLTGDVGKCNYLHGHSYKLLVGVSGVIQKDGMVLNFSLLKKDMQRIINEYDHVYLNDYYTQPTAENMVQKIYNILDTEIKKYERLDLKLNFVRLYETASSYAEIKY